MCACVWRTLICLFFFFQAEDGIRDVAVTGVQTCALPISIRGRSVHATPAHARSAAVSITACTHAHHARPHGWRLPRAGPRLSPARTLSSQAAVSGLVLDGAGKDPALPGGRGVRRGPLPPRAALPTGIPSCA